VDSRIAALGPYDGGLLWAGATELIRVCAQQPHGKCHHVSGVIASHLGDCQPRSRLGSRPGLYGASHAAREAIATLVSDDVEAVAMYTLWATQNPVRPPLDSDRSDRLRRRRRRRPDGAACSYLVFGHHLVGVAHCVIQGLARTELGRAVGDADAETDAPSYGVDNPGRRHRRQRVPPVAVETHLRRVCTPSPNSDGVLQTDVDGAEKLIARLVTEAVLIERSLGAVGQQPAARTSMAPPPSRASSPPMP
jgi:hypothetical protein